MSFCDVLKFDVFRHTELERRSREKEDALGLMREAHARELHEERGKISEMQAQLDRMILEQERRQKSHTDDLHHREQQIHEYAKLLSTEMFSGLFILSQKILKLYCIKMYIFMKC